jgi:hypothetical protein
VVQAIRDGAPSPSSQAPANMDAVREISRDSELDADAHGREQTLSVPDALNDAGPVPCTPAHQTPEVSLSLALSYDTADG